MAPSLECAPSLNPRKLGRCIRCDRQVPQSTSDRDSAYEAKFLREVSARAERRFGLATGGFQQAVDRRLALGQQRYGDSYMAKAPAARALDILEEAWDAAAYALLDVQKRLANETDDTAVWHLFEIAQHAAAIDSHARSLRSCDS